MDCKTARLVLEFHRPGSAELDTREADALRGHLAECADCKAVAETESLLDDRLGKALRDVPVPTGLRDRLCLHLDDERRVAYRRWAFRRVGELAAAAAVLIAAGVGYSYWQASRRVIIDTELFASAEEMRGSRAEDSEEWFRQEYSLNVVLPRNLNYLYLYDRELRDLEHRTVACLRFRHGEHRADVFVLRAKDFNLDACLKQPRKESLGITIEVIPCQTDPNTAYLFRYTGSSLDWLEIDGQVPLS